MSVSQDRTGLNIKYTNKRVEIRTIMALLFNGHYHFPFERIIRCPEREIMQQKIPDRMLDDRFSLII